MECILIHGIRVIRGQTNNDSLSQSTVRRECVVGATSERFSLFSIFAHRECVAFIRESNLRKVDAPFWTTNRTNHTNVGWSVFLFVAFV